MCYNITSDFRQQVILTFKKMKTFKTIFKIELQFIFNCIYFWLCGVFAAAWAFSSCSEWGLLFSDGVRASHCGRFSCCGAPALGHVGSIVVVHRLSSLAACGIFLGCRSNPCPALAGRFLTAGPSWKSFDNSWSILLSQSKFSGLLWQILKSTVRIKFCCQMWDKILAKKRNTSKFAWLV